MTVNSTTTLTDSNASGISILSGGTLSGTGTIVGNVSNSGTIFPATNGTAGILTVTGNYVQTSSGNLDVDLGGLTAGSEFDQLTVSGSASIAGTMNVDEINGFAPTSGNSFPVLTAGSTSGKFGNINGLLADDQVLLVANYSNTAVSLVGFQGGIFVTPTAGLTTTQAGGTATFTVVLDGAPAANVTIGLSSSNTSAGMVSPSQLIFTPQNWNTAQTVTVTGVNDFIDHGSQGQAYTIITAPAVSTDPVYSGFDPSDVAVTNKSTMVAGFAVTPTTGLQTSQAGGTASFTVGALVRAAGQRRLRAALEQHDAGTESPASLTFTPQNWNTPQSVIVTGVNDGMADGNVAYTIVTQPAVSTDPLYSALDPPDVAVTNLGTNLLDLQVANLTVTPSANLQSGNNVTVSWNDTVTGNIATPAGFSDNVTVTNTTTGQTLVNTQVFYNPATAGNGPIEPGQGRAQHDSFQLPNGPAGAGQLQVTVTTNSTTAFPEFNTSGTASSNNIASLTVTSALAPYPDLQVTNLAVQPATGLQSGGNLVVSWSDSNSGNGSVAGSFDDKVTITNLTTNQVLTSGTVLYNFSTSGPILAGAAQNQQFPYQLPDGTPGVGQLQVTVTTDSGNAIVEYNSAGTAETNNTTSTTVTSAIAPYPDLQPTGLQLSGATGLQSGQNVTVEWNDANTGNGAAAGSWTDTLVVKNTTTGQTLDTKTVSYNGSASGNGPLGAGESYAQQTTILLPDGTPGVGSIQFTVTVDSANNIFEYNSAGTAESNNTTSITQTSTLAAYPDLQVLGLQLNPAAASPARMSRSSGTTPTPATRRPSVPGPTAWPS